MDLEFYKNLLTIPQSYLHNAVQGGITIAIMSSLYYALFGGILGMSGMAGSLIKFPQRDATKAKAIVVLGIFFASALLNTLYQYQKIANIPFDNVQITLGASSTHLIIAGALVGVGTELSNGCTSGHGLCGLPRLSIRSFTAVMIFLPTAIVTATFSLSQHIPQLSFLKFAPIEKMEINPLYYLIASLLIAIVVIFFVNTAKPFMAKVSLFVIGIIFGFGLMIAGMSKRQKIYGFLVLDKNWDPSLLFVLMTGVTINLFTFTIIKKLIKKPVYGEKIEDSHGKVTLKLIIGSILFGLGWGIGGLCPGPYLLSIPNSLRIAVYWGLPFFITQKLFYLLFDDSRQHHKQVKQDLPHHQKKAQ